MTIAWIDVTIPMEPGMTVWPGDEPFSFAPSSRVAEGAECNTSHVSFGTHCGTHIDAPWHFEEDGKRVHEIDPAVYFGEAQVIEVPDADIVTADDLGPEPLAPRILIKTRNSLRPAHEPFDTNFVALAPDAAQRCVDEGVRLVGVDYLSVAPYKQPGQSTHHILLQNDVLVVEGLQLARIAPGPCLFTCLPLLIRGADGAPCRAFVGHAKT